MCLISKKKIKPLKQDFKVIFRKILEDSKQLFQIPLGNLRNFSLNSES